MARKPASGAPAAAERSFGAELGVTGLRTTGGSRSTVLEEFLPELFGVRGMRAYQEMAQNDPTIGAALSAVGLVLRAVQWRAEANPDAPSQEAAQAEAAFAQSLLVDMSTTFEDFIAEMLTMLPYGWSYFELVFKRRVGPLEADAAKRSRFTDGRIGVRKIAPRAQDTLSRWEFDDDGGVSGMWQIPPTGGGEIFLPITRSLLFRTTSRKSSPEGVSILRNAYRPWYFHKNVQEFEAIGIERDLAGLPVIKIPNTVLTGTSATDLAAKDRYAQMARDMRFNRQGGVVIPSDTFMGEKGPTNVPLVDVSLIASAGARTIDTMAVKTGYQRDMARCVLADFLMLGTDKGAYNLSESKTNLFLKACETYIDSAQEVLNRHLLPRIWALNGLDMDLMPRYVRGRLAPADLTALGDLIQKLSAAGAALFPDDNLENHIREEAELPLRTEETAAQQEAAAQEAHDAALALVEARKPTPGGDEGGGFEGAP